MEQAIAAVDLGRYRRILQMFWDPEPTNDRERNVPVWCLGCQYTLTKSPPAGREAPASSQRRGDGATTPPSQDYVKPEVPVGEPGPSSSPSAAGLSAAAVTPTPPDSASSSFDSSLAYDSSSPASGASSGADDGGWPPAFLDDFESRIWMTYRSEFASIPRSTDPRAVLALSMTMRIKSQLLVDQNGFSSDSGWGCMIRSGQSLLANAMLVNRLGREWRRSMGDAEERHILSLFADDPRAPFSIHNFVDHGARACGKYPGEWFGPSATARCIRALTNERELGLRVYATDDGHDVYEDSFMDIANPTGEEFHPTLLLVSTRLGIDKITPVYWEALIASLQMKQSIGIAGGRPSSSHYFVGAQGQYLFYLDPHQTRPALPYYTNVASYSQADVDSCHTRRLRRIHVREMDPSMLVGFLIKDEEDWLDWKRGIKHVQGKPIIHVSDNDPAREGAVSEREGAIDEVETISDDGDGDTDTVLDL